MQRLKDRERNRIFHFRHRHALSICKHREYGYTCEICHSRLWGISYGCVDCEFFIHESCADMPQTIKHPAHPLHPLRCLDFTQMDSYHHCNACKTFEDIYFCCHECNFNLSVGCAYSLMCTLKHECHPHGLLYLAKDYTNYSEYAFPCYTCGAADCREDGNFYRCVQCDLNFHFECVPIPRVIKHRNHLHSLALIDSFVEDDSGEYYCDVCETERNPEHHVYCCEECPFVAHIHCALSEKETSSKMVFSLIPYIEGAESSNTGETVVQKGMELKEANQETNPEYSGLKIQHVSHHHALSLCEEMVNVRDQHCEMCRLKPHGPAYMCESCSFFVNKSCAELPTTLVKHPLHQNCTHHLILLKLSPNFPKPFICDNCRDISKGFNFYCQKCQFTVDLKCASPIENELSNYAQVRRVKEREQKTSIVHFTHPHALASANDTNIDIMKALQCKTCGDPIFGQIYCCLKCEYFCHESCLQYPKEMQHPFHMPHPLQLQLLEYTPYFWRKCYACGLRISGFMYCCKKCDLYLHIKCVVRSLRHKRHKHNLYYFHGESYKTLYYFFGESYKDFLYFFPNDFLCNICNEHRGNSFYRCEECDLNFHLKCLSLPCIVKHKRHWHPLTLMDKVVEDDFEEYYCEVCETERNAEHPVYYCKECTYIAHIEYIIS